jgi:hypothetical protein
MTRLRFHRAFNLAGDQVGLEYAPSSRRIIPEVESAIETAWEQAMHRPGIRLFDGPMCRLESWKATDDHLSLVLSSSSYKSFLGTNMSHPEFADLFGCEVMANPVGVSPALHTADGFLMLGYRNQTMAYYPGRVHPFSGCLEPSDGDLFLAVHRELKEELSFGEGDVEDIRCSGIAEDMALRQQEFIFTVNSSRTRAQVEAKLDAAEHCGALSIPATTSAIERCVDEESELTPIAIAALMLWGRIQFGGAWFERAAVRRATMMELLWRRG